MIYIIGDSHSRAFTYEKDTEYIFKTYTPKIKGIFTSISTEPFVVYNLCNKIGLFKNIIQNLKINPTDYLCFCYGEVDVRCHIGFIADKNKESIDCICDKIADRYMIFLLEIKKIHDKICVYGSIPSGPYNGIQGNGRPSYKTQLERNNINKILNKCVKNKCLKQKIIFKNINSITNDYFIEKNTAGIEDMMHLSIKVQPILTKLFHDLI